MFESHPTLDSNNCLSCKGETTIALCCFYCVSEHKNKQSVCLLVGWFTCISPWNSYRAYWYEYEPTFKISLYVFVRPAVGNWELSVHRHGTTSDSVHTYRDCRGTSDAFQFCVLPATVNRSKCLDILSH